MKNRNEFFHYVMENMQRYLPTPFADAQISIKESEAGNGIKVPALLIRRPEDTTVLYLPLEEAYRRYREGSHLDSCVKQLADLQIACDHLKYLSDLNDMSDYEKIKDKLMIKLCDPELNMEWLDDKIYTLHGDFAAVYYMMLYEGKEKRVSMPVTKQLMEEWKVPIKQIHEDAMLLERKKQAVLMEMDDYWYLASTDSGINRNLLDEEAEWHPEMAEKPMLCLTNSSMENGASMILQEDLMKRIGELIGSDFYILPSSIHETLLVPLGVMDVSELSQMVKEVNEIGVELCDRLSDKVLYYDREKGVFENAEKKSEEFLFRKE